MKERSKTAVAKSPSTEGPTHADLRVPNPNAPMIAEASTTPNGEPLRTDLQARRRRAPAIAIAEENRRELADESDSP